MEKEEVTNGISERRPQGNGTEIGKGSCPLMLDYIEFEYYSYQEITSKEKLLEVLSYLLRIGDFKQYVGRTVVYNIYMDLQGKKPVRYSIYK